MISEHFTNIVTSTVRKCKVRHNLISKAWKNRFRKSPPSIKHSFLCQAAFGQQHTMLYFVLWLNTLQRHFSDSTVHLCCVNRLSHSQIKEGDQQTALEEVAEMQECESLVNARRESNIGHLYADRATGPKGRQWTDGTILCENQRS